MYKVLRLQKLRKTGTRADKAELTLARDSSTFVHKFDHKVSLDSSESSRELTVATFGTPSISNTDMVANARLATGLQPGYVKSLAPPRLLDITDISIQPLQDKQGQMSVFPNPHMNTICEHSKCLSFLHRFSVCANQKK